MNDQKTGDRDKVNREVKDRLFRFIFGREDNKEAVLSLYNALNGTSYSDPEELQITTLADVIYVSMKNDVSFLLHGQLSLWEHQSTINPNMPIRGFLYTARLYEKYFVEQDINIYSTSLKKIPTPKYYVFYNGEKDYPAVNKLKLSDAFLVPANNGEYEWTAIVYNLNVGKNPELLKKCKPMADYMELINRIREKKRIGISNEAAVDQAIVECIRDGIMDQFLLKHRAEVIDVILTEFNETTYRKGIYEDGREEGLQEGLQEGKLKTLFELVKEGLLTVTQASINAELSEDQFVMAMNKAGYR